MLLKGRVDVFSEWHTLQGLPLLTCAIDCILASPTHTCQSSNFPPREAWVLGSFPERPAIGTRVNMIGRRNATVDRDPTSSGLLARLTADIVCALPSH